MAKTYTVTLTMPDGKRKYYRGKTKREAEAKRDKDKAALNQGLLVGDETLFKDFAEVWLSFKHTPDLHARSFETIRETLDRYILPVLGGFRVNAIKPLHIRKLMLIHAAYSCSTQTKIAQYTKSILAMAVENGLISTSPFLDSIKPGGAKPEEVEPLSDAQCRELLDAVKGTRVWLFVMVLRYAGLRKGEALGLMWNDIDFNANTLTVNRSLVYTKTNRNGEINPECKTAAAHRTIPLAAQLREALKKELESSKSLYVFSMGNGKPLSEASFRRMWDLIRYRSVRTPSTKTTCTASLLNFSVHPHQLRHTCITAWVAAGMDPKQVMYLAGHSTMDVTMEIYSHYMETLRRAAASEKIELSVANL